MPGSQAHPAATAPHARRALCLASRSPRRRQLLTEFGIPHLSRHPGVEDSTLAPGSVDPAAWVAALAFLKARAGCEQPWETEGLCPLVLGADTACVKGTLLLGTPTDAGDAERILTTLSDGEHEVVTGVALLDPTTGERRLLADRAKVRVGRIPPTDLREYLISGLWAGKAGAYNLRERLDAGWPIEFDGDPSTIMGLPMLALARLLPALGVPVPGSRRQEQTA